MDGLDTSPKHTYVRETLQIDIGPLLQFKVCRLLKLTYLITWEIITQNTHYHRIVESSSSLFKKNSTKGSNPFIPISNTPWLEHSNPHNTFTPSSA